MSNEQETGERKNWYDKSYKWLLLIPAILLVFSIVFLIGFNAEHGDLIEKDVSLTGGTTLTIFDESVDLGDLREALKEDFDDSLVRGISDIRSGKQQGFFIETKAEPEEIKGFMEEYLGYGLTQDNSSVEFTGATLSQGFYKQLINSIIAAFLLMGWVVFLIFGDSFKIKIITTILTFLGLKLSFGEFQLIGALSIIVMVLAFIYGAFKLWDSKKDLIQILVCFVVSIGIFFFYSVFFLIWIVGILLLVLYGLYSIPSLAVILSAFADIVMAVWVVDILEIKVSSAGVVAFLMLIGYSVDTDILLTTRVLKKAGKINENLFGAFKTGMMMTITSILAIGVALIVIYNFSDVLRQMFTILLIGLGFDLVNTWFANAGIIKWYAEKKYRKEYGGLIR